MAGGLKLIRKTAANIKMRVVWKSVQETSPATSVAYTIIFIIATMLTYSYKNQDNTRENCCKGYFLDVLLNETNTKAAY